MLGLINSSTMNFQSCSFVLVILVSLMSRGFAQNVTNLVCYDCDPTNNAEQCANPVQNGVQQTNCDQKFPERSPNSTLICLTAHITYSGDSNALSGVHRGCFVQEPSVESFCDWFKQETDNRNGAVAACVPCNSTRCNTVTLDDNGQPNRGSSAINVAVTVAVVSFLFSVLF